MIINSNIVELVNSKYIFVIWLYVAICSSIYLFMNEFVEFDWNKQHQVQNFLWNKKKFCAYKSDINGVLE